MFAVTVNESEALPETLPETAENESHAAVVLALQFNFPFPELEMPTVRVNEVLSPSVAEKLRPVGLRLIVGFGPMRGLVSRRGGSSTTTTTSREQGDAEDRQSKTDRSDAHDAPPVTPFCFYQDSVLAVVMLTLQTEITAMGAIGVPA